MWWLFLLCEFIILFLTSQALSQSLFLLFYQIVRSRRIAIWILAILFFPGVLIHELSHFIAANALFVPTGEIEFLPEVRGDTVKLGSVQVAKTDPLRNFLIGVAPVIIGSMIIAILSWYISQYQILNIKNQIMGWEIGIYILVLYGIFVIANTMFSSKKDLEGAVGVVIFILILCMTIFFANRGAVIQLLGFLNGVTMIQNVQRIDALLLIPVGINVLLAGGLRMIKK